ncbi:hypothetical protein [Undibacter mobilis]|uniref:hypothetical protein n=1 Tax=Undibacter mobilis TaxID=2292256 RepID=UPI001AED0369|nr:hypothetical protein [Undibacter mobilis]
MIGFGVPISEFSFGNTLIIAGTVAMVGGLIVLALGVVVRELQHLADVSGRSGTRNARPPETDAQVPTRPVPATAAARVPFPPKPKVAPPADTMPREASQPLAHEAPDELPPAFTMRRPIRAPVTSPMVTQASSPRPEEELFGAPTLPNPDEEPAFDRDETPTKTAAAAPRDVPEVAQKTESTEWEKAEAEEWDDAAKADETVRVSEGADRADESELFGKVAVTRAPRALAPSAEKAERSYFDAMWPVESESAKPAEITSAPLEEPDIDREPPIEEPRTVPILKSGVVDGMGYTLYVDGSIEAELPQGTLRFASINELRAHLERTA